MGTPIENHLETSLGVNRDPSGGREIFVQGLSTVLSVGDNTLPGGPAAGSRVILGASPTGLAAGHPNAVATINSIGQWGFADPGPAIGVGWTYVVYGTTDVVTWTGTAWDAVGGGGVASEVGNDSGVAGATVADALDALDTDVGTALAAANEADDTADAAAALAVLAQADADVALVALGYGGTSILHLYVDGVAGLDVNDGLSTAAPIQTFTRLYELLPVVYGRHVVVHLAPGLGAGAINYDLPAPIPYYTGTKSLFFLADESWALTLGRSVYTQVATGAAAIGSAFNVVVAASALTLNAHRGYSIRFLTGAAANGAHRTIRDNTTTAWTPISGFSPGPAVGDTYEVFTNNIAIRPSGTDSMVLTCGSTAANPTEGVGFIGVDFDTLGVTGNNQVLFGAGYVHLYGTRSRVSAISTQFRAGASCGNATADVALNEILGVTPATRLLGWGHAAESALVVINGGFGESVGTYFSIKGTTSVLGYMSVQGGFLAAANVDSHASAYLNVSGSASTPTWVGDIADTTTKITCRDGLVNMTSNTVVSNTSTTNPTVLVERRGSVRFGAATITGSNAASVAGGARSVRCRRGGRVFTTGQPAFGHATDADYECEGTTANKTALAAADSRIANASFPESVIRREA